MAGYIKSHSNYRLQTRHQVTNNGVIYERDISTVGGVNTFATGQSTMYQSGNFVILINNSKSPSRHIKKGGWLSSGLSDDVWDNEKLSGYTSDINASVEDKVIIKNDFLDLRSFAYYGSITDLIQNTITKIISTFPYEMYITDNVLSSNTTTYNELIRVNTFEKGELEGCYYVSNPGDIDIYNIEPNKLYEDSELGHFYNNGYTNYSIYSENVVKSIDDWSTSGMSLSVDCKQPWKIFNTIKITVHSGTTIEIYAYWDNNLEVKYISKGNNGIHIRPSMDKSYYSDFVDGLDLFGKCLIGEYSDIKNTAKFEIIEETENGFSRNVRMFVFPTSYGGYNLGSDDISMERYISDLGSIALRYDNLYTDNLYRMMTHDSLKNLDWTRNFNGTSEEYENEYTKNGEKFSSLIRIIGYEFDKEKTCIDNIGFINTVTYSGVENLSDYFLTDSLETDGWVVKSIYPYELKEYNSNGDDVTESSDIWVEDEQVGNVYKRKFSEITSITVRPYEYNDIVYYTGCENGVFKDIEIENYSGGTYYYVENDGIYNVIKNYHSENEYTLPYVNNEFMKRFKINSKHILRKKGTIDGIESLLSLFGLKSKRWAEENGLFDDYDYEINEHIMFSPPIKDEYRNDKNDYKYNWYNRCKTISYATPSSESIEYIDYQGLPVAYREIESNENGNTTIERKLYPFFGQSGIYDGGMYYQMYGGWIGYSPYMFDTNEKLIKQREDNLNRVETMRNVMMVNNMDELISQPNDVLYDGIVYYVNDISGKYALIDGHPYKLKEDIYQYTETQNGGTSQTINETTYYFELEIYGGSITFGDTMFVGDIEVSDISNCARKEDANGEKPEIITKKYDLNLYKDGTLIKIYYTGDEENAFVVSEYYDDSEIADIEDDTQDNNDTEDSNENQSYIFINGRYYNSDDSEENVSKYFKLTDINNSNKIGVGAWEKIKTSSNEYIKIESVIDKTDGNNPHNGNNYDNGEEYINRFKKIFKYASENRLFNEICFPDVAEAYNDINSFGFDSIGDFVDGKVHSFTDTINNTGVITRHNNDEKSSLSGLSFYNSIREYNNVDGVTSQIVNTKLLDITFILKNNDAFGKKVQEEIKYIQSKIMPYVEQMLPSTSIVNVKFYSIDYSKEYLTFKALEDTTFTFSQNSLQYSLDDGETWTELSANTNTPTINSGSKIMWKQTGLSATASGIGTFSSTGNFNAYGNIMSLYYGDDFEGQTGLTGKSNAFRVLFSNCSNLISTENLILPATTLAGGCYTSMFSGCTSLTKAPELPATTLVTSCYYSMFRGCTSLTIAPKLPATTLASSCYSNMFYGCASLTIAPELPATTLSDSCYGYMFNACVSLTTAPELPATTLANHCYSYMFQDCTSLNYIKCLATDISATYSLSGWVYRVSSTGTFVKNASMTSWSTGNSGIPKGWDIVDA